MLAFKKSNRSVKTIFYTKMLLSFDRKLYYSTIQKEMYLDVYSKKN